EEEKKEEKKEDEIALPHLSADDLSSKQVRMLFMGDAKTQSHIDALRADPVLYARQLQTMIDKRLATDWTSATRARILAASLACKQAGLVPFLLKQKALFSVAEVLRAAQILDASRHARQLQRKLAQL